MLPAAERTARKLPPGKPQGSHLGTSLLTIDRSEQGTRFTALRQSLSEETFAAAWETGRAMTWQEAVRFALNGESS
jgi:hypothetical protein